MKHRNDDALLSVAETVSDGNPVDWDAERESRGESEEDLKHLRLVAAVADAHRQVRPRRTNPTPQEFGDSRPEGRAGAALPSARHRRRSPWLWLVSALVLSLTVLAGWYAYARLFE
ncbi:MAG TPA: hypothetical protein VGR38_09230 [Candidatus Polarisedimenticolia bacterium]|nr:hypothetical protein [Candidatus Polarisedimenticolia bacterium]